MGFIERNIIAVTGLAILVLLVVAFKLWAQWLIVPRLDEPISINAKATIDKAFRLPASDRYYLSLIFDRENVPFEKLSSLIGHTGMEPIGAPPGIVIPMSWELSNLDLGAVVAKGTQDTKGSNSWSNTEVGRLLQSVDASAGNYRFRANVQRDVPEFTGLKTRIRLELIPKLGQSWQMVVWWWGHLLSMFVALPAGVLLVAWLAYRGLTQGGTDGP